MTSLLTSNAHLLTKNLAVMGFATKSKDAISGGGGGRGGRPLLKER